MTVRVAEGKPGEELQLDFGAVGWIAEGGRRRRVWALVLTAVVSRYQYVWLTYHQSVVDVVAGCEAAWTFFGGVFRVLIPGGPENFGAASQPFIVHVAPAPASSLTPEAPGNTAQPSEGSTSPAGEKEH